MNVSVRKILLFGLVLSMASSELAVAAEAPSGSTWKKYLAAATVGAAALGAAAFLVKKSSYKQCRRESRLLPEVNEFEIHGMCGDSITIVREYTGSDIKVDVVIRAHCKETLDSALIDYKSDADKHIVMTTSKRDSASWRSMLGFLFVPHYSATPRVDYTITVPDEMRKVSVKNENGSITIQEVQASVLAEMRGAGKVDIRSVPKQVVVTAGNGSRINIQKVGSAIAKIDGHGDINISDVERWDTDVNVMAEGGTVNVNNVAGGVRHRLGKSCKMTTSQIGRRIEKLNEE